MPHKHVDHVHADAVIAIAASENAETLTREIFGGKLGFLPWQRPGFDLGLKLGRMARDNPQLEGVVLGGHGLFTWGPTSKTCYETTIRIINQAVAWLAANGKEPAFGGAAVEALPAERRREIAARLMPAIRARISSAERKIGHFTDAPEVLEFVNSRDLKPLAALGTSCPDHFLRTKIRPLVLSHDADAAALDAALAAYRADYAAYYERCKHPDSPAMRDPNAVVYLIPQVGMITFAKDKATARISAEFYVNAINVMRGASSVSKYVGPGRAGGVQHRILVARGGQASAHAEAEIARRPRRADHRRGRRHRLGDCGAVDGRGRLRRARRHRPREPRQPASPNSASASARTRSRARRWT